jgi:Zn-dependent M28 family amino/carboxypeptidase
VPGTLHPDSFVVFTAHYDHLGLMGRHNFFPGANDNASGVALLISLADYFQHHPQPYSVVFLAFSGEEAGLLGSGYFADHPPIKLSSVRFLINP